MIIMADYHHGGLYNSLKFLAKRLDAPIYRPIGLDWFNEGYWKIAEPYGNAPETIRQYLSTEPYENVDLYCNTGARSGVVKRGGPFITKDVAHHSIDYAITLELFKDIKFDVLIVSYPWHLESWLELQKKYQPHAKLILQVGNNGWQQFFPLVKNVLSSARNSRVPKNLNYVEYRQEFDLNIFNPELGLQAQAILSFVNCLPAPDYYERLKADLPEFNFKAFGAGSPDGVITGIKNIAAMMKSARLAYHYKPGGDGYGHIIHNLFACGIPVIGDYTQYRGQLAEDLFDISTCIPMSRHAVLTANAAENYETWRQRIITRFQNVVNFDDEFQTKLKPFFENLQ